MFVTFTGQTDLLEQSSIFIPDKLLLACFPPPSTRGGGGYFPPPFHMYQQGNSQFCNSPNFKEQPLMRDQKLLGLSLKTLLLLFPRSNH